MAHGLMLVAVIALFPVAGQAQRGPCAGDGPNPMFTVSTGNPVVLNFQHATSFLLLPPFVENDNNGNHIAVAQFMVFPPPQLLPDSGFSPCNRQSISLGELQPGSYQVIWKYYDARSHPPQAVFAAHYFLTVPSAVPAMSQPALIALVLACAAIGAVMLRR